MKKYIYALSLLFLVSCGSGRKNPFKNAGNLNNYYKNNPKEISIDFHYVVEDNGKLSVGPLDYQEIQTVVEGVVTSYKEIDKGLLRTVEYDISYDKNEYITNEVSIANMLAIITDGNDFDEKIEYDTIKVNETSNTKISYNDTYTEAVEVTSTNRRESIRDSIISESFEEDTVLVKFDYANNTITNFGENPEGDEYYEKIGFSKQLNFNYRLVLGRSSFLEQVFYNKNGFIERTESSDVKREGKWNVRDTLCFSKRSFDYYEYDKYGNPLKILIYLDTEPARFRIFKYKY